MRRGAHIVELLKQEPWNVLSLEVQAILLALPFTPIFNDKEAVYVEKNKVAIVKAVTEHTQLAELRKSARRGTISFNEFVKRLTREVPVIESVCRA